MPFEVFTEPTPYVPTKPRKPCAWPTCGYTVPLSGWFCTNGRCASQRLIAQHSGMVGDRPATDDEMAAIAKYHARQRGYLRTYARSPKRRETVTTWKRRRRDQQHTDRVAAARSDLRLERPARVPEEPPTVETWRDHARCRGIAVDVFYPARGDMAGLRSAKALCAECPVADYCLADALTDDQHYGVRGGASARERLRLTTTARVAAG